MAACALLLIAGVLSPAAALTMGKKKMKCPLSGVPMTATVVNSYTRFGMRLDLKPIGALIAPFPLPVCPDSGFVVYRDDFSVNELDAFRKLVKTVEFKTLRKANTDYFMAAYQAEKIGAKPRELAHLTLQASWEADGDRARYVRYATLALERYRATRATAEKSSQRWRTAQLLVVNFHRRLGQFEEAKQALAALPTDKKPAKSVYRKVAGRLNDLIAQKNDDPAQLRPRKRRKAK